MIKKVAVCLDGSELAEQVIPYASEVATKFDAILVLLQVIGMDRVPPLAGFPEAPVEGYTGEMVLEYTRAEKNAAMNYLEELAGQLREQGLKVECETPEGTSAGVTIIDFTHESEVDLIAIATHGRTGLERTVFGSVADHIIRQSSLPVLVIKPQQAD
ncbi:MAG: universal stress protein [Dehalococcoidia bacterium]